MTNEEQAQILNLDCEGRYDYFLSVAGEEREIWILINDEQCFLKLVAEDDDYEYIPVWPSADLAAAYADGDAGLSPKCVSLPEFLKKWVPGLSGDGIEIGVIPGEDKSVWITQAVELAQDLQEELARF